MATLNGFIKLHRKLVAWGWYKDDVVKGVFLHLLLTSNFKETPWRDIVLQRGQLVTSYQSLAQNIGHTVQEVRTAINKLKSTGEITIKSTNKYTLITVVNWEDYQMIDEEATDTSTQSATNEQQTTNKQLTNNQQQRKNDKNNKNNKKEINKEKSQPLDLHLYKPDGSPLPLPIREAGLTWEEYLERKNQ